MHLNKISETHEDSYAVEFSSNYGTVVVFFLFYNHKKSYTKILP